MAEGHGWGGASCVRSNHPAPASASAAAPYPRRGALVVLMPLCLEPKLWRSYPKQRRRSLSYSTLPKKAG